MDLTTQLSLFLTQLFSGVVGGTGNGVSAWTFTLGTSLVESAADVLEQYRSTNGQTYLLYNTRTDASNYERLSIGWSSNKAIFEAAGAGTGSPRSMEFRSTLNLNLTGTTTTQFQFSGTTGTFTGVAASAALGYGTGAGGTVTQLTSKATGVELNKVTGEITTHNAALAAATIVSFALTNTSIAAGDHVQIQHVSGGTVGAYTCTAVAAAGSATVYIRNATAGSLSEAIVLKFMVFKSATA